MRYWLTTDTHFGHNNIIEWCKRPKDYEQKILNGLSNTVGIHDILIHLGDIHFNDSKFWHDRLREACQPMSKWLIKGNHDKLSNTYYHSQGWDIVCEQIEMKLYGRSIILSHKPVWCDMQHINIHGHFHNVDSNRWEKNLVALLTPSHHILCIEQLNYIPVTLQWAVDHLPYTKDRL